MKIFPMSRRTFLAGAAAAGGAAALPLAGAPVPTTRPGGGAATLKWGIIGTGTRGAYTHIPVLKEAPESQIVALCDVDAARLEHATSMVPNPVQAFDDYHKLLESADVNAVVIAVPNLLHLEVLGAVLAAGKHVLCEKPAGANMAQAMGMKKLADEAKTVVMFGMQYRNTAKQKKILELIAEGRIGKPKYMVQNCSRGDWNLSPNVWRYSDPKVLGGKPVNWRFSHTASGGTLNEFSCHYFDLLHGMAGATPQRIGCEGGTSVYQDGRDTWDHASVTMKYPNGLTAVHTLSMFGPGRADVTVMGDEGFIDAGAGDSLKLTVFGKKGASRKSQEIKPTEPEGHAADRATLGLYQDFLECFKTGKKPTANAERAVAASRTCWLAELAASRGAEVGWEESLG